MNEQWWDQPLDALDAEQWEALCDGCGKCCMAKLQDADTGEIYYTNVACELLDLNSCRCTDYANRTTKVPDCISLSLQRPQAFDWLPATCAYKLRFHSKPLFDWHPLLSKDANSTHQRGISMQGKAISQQEAGPLDHHIVDI